GDAVETRDIEVHQDDVGAKLRRQEDRIVSPRGLADDPHPRPQQASYELSKALVVVDDQHSQRHVRLSPRACAAPSILQIIRRDGTSDNRAEAESGLGESMKTVTGHAEDPSAAGWSE